MRRQVLEAIGEIIHDRQSRNIVPAVALSIEISRARHIPAAEVRETADILIREGIIVSGPTVNDTYYKFNRTTESTVSMNEFEKVIEAHLDSRAANDEVFRTKYESRGEKAVEECCRYIISEVKKSGRCGFADDEIFGMAVHFIDENLKAPASVPTASVVVNHSSKKPAEKYPETPQKSPVAASKGKADKLPTKTEKTPEKARKRAMTAEEVQRKKEEEGCLFFFDAEEGWK